MLKKYLLFVLCGVLLSACADIPGDALGDEAADLQSENGSAHGEVVVDTETASDSVNTELASAQNLNTLPSWSQLVNGFETLSTAQIANKLAHLDPTERLQLSTYDAFGGMLHLLACQADSSVLLQTTQGIADCAYQMQQWANTFQFLPDPAQAFSYALEQRAQIQIAHQCSTGELDAGSCSNYTQTLAQFNNQSHETAMTIINNMGGTSCLVGQDPNCY